MVVGGFGAVTAALGSVDWVLFALLTGAGVVGVLAVLPSQLVGRELDRSLPSLVGTAVGVNGLLVGAAVLAGLTLGPRAGFAVVGSMPGGLAGYVAVAALGALVGAVLVVLDLRVFAALLPDDAGETSADVAGERPGPLLGALASLYGGLTEELLVRFGLVSLLAWAGWRLLAPGASAPPGPVAWGAIVLATLAFGAGHLPATAGRFGLTPATVARALVLNGLAGLVFGWLYWTGGLLAAMVAHTVADLVVHAVVPAVTSDGSVPRTVQRRT